MLTTPARTTAASVVTMMLSNTPRCWAPLRGHIITAAATRKPYPPPFLAPYSNRPSLRRPFSCVRALQKHHNLPPRPEPPPESEIEESFLKGSGPGGQKINKTNSAVQLKHVPTGIVVKTQATRSRSQNRTIARRLLAERLDDLARGGESRSAVVGRFRGKRKASAAKKSRRKYRRLEEEKEGKEKNNKDDEDDDDDDDDDGEEGMLEEEEDEDGDGEQGEGRIDTEEQQRQGEPSRSHNTPSDQGR